MPDRVSVPLPCLVSPLLGKAPGPVPEITPAKVVEFALPIVSVSRLRLTALPATPDRSLNVGLNGGPIFSVVPAAARLKLADDADPDKAKPTAPPLIVNV